MLSRVILFFDLIVTNIIEATNIQPHEQSIQTLIRKMKNLNLLSQIIFLLCDIIAIFFITLFYIPGINNLCNQIFILRKTFKIVEMHE